MWLVCVFFFSSRRRHTRWPRDWSSDVCSSDLCPWTRSRSEEAPMSITLRSRRGAIGTNWHAVALREAMEIILGVGRAGGGKADARAGKTQWLDVSAGTARGDEIGRAHV